jgi:hypothetical protein
VAENVATSPSLLPAAFSGGHDGFSRASAPPSV